MATGYDFRTGSGLYYRELFVRSRRNEALTGIASGANGVAEIYIGMIDVCFAAVVLTSSGRFVGDSAGKASRIPILPVRLKVDPPGGSHFAINECVKITLNSGAECGLQLPFTEWAFLVSGNDTVLGVVRLPNPKHYLPEPEDNYPTLSAIKNSLGASFVTRPIANQLRRLLPATDSLKDLLCRSRR